SSDVCSSDLTGVSATSVEMPPIMSSHASQELCLTGVTPSSPPHPGSAVFLALHFDLRSGPPAPGSSPAPRPSAIGVLRSRGPRPHGPAPTAGGRWCGGSGPPAGPATPAPPGCRPAAGPVVPSAPQPPQARAVG